MQRKNNAPFTRRVHGPRPYSKDNATSAWAFLPCILACILFLPSGCGTGLSSLDSGSSSSDQSTTDQSDSSSTDTADYADSLEDAASDNYEEQDDVAGYSWTDSETVTITLSENSIAVDGPGATVDGNTVTISSAANYKISGSLSDGQIIVDTDDEDPVQLIFSGIDITSYDNAPIYIANAEQVSIVLDAGTSNFVQDSSPYTLDDPESDEPNATIFSKSDLTISGSGSLTVDANYNDGIASKDGLTISSGNITIDSVDDGIRGKDYIIIKGGTLDLNVGGDGLKSDNDTDTTRGYISIEAGTVTIVCDGDGMDAATDVLIAGGTFDIVTAGGSDYHVDETDSAKGIKGGVNVIIDKGSFDIDSADDGLHSNGTLTVNGGTFVIYSSDDGIHGDSDVVINGGGITILESYEGMESNTILTINGGEMRITASDDGLNVAGGIDGSGLMPGWQTGQTGQGGQFVPGGMGGMGGGGLLSKDSSTNYLYINGGYISVDAEGDGLDCNGHVEMTAGTVLVSGPTDSMNGALDHQSFVMTGGFLVAAGSSGMLEGLSSSSTQYSVTIRFNSTIRGGTLCHIEDGSDTNLLTFAPDKNYQSLVFSSPDLSAGSTYTVYYGGSSTGTSTDGLYDGGTYSGGTEYGSFSPTSVVTSVGSQRW